MLSLEFFAKKKLFEIDYLNTNFVLISRNTYFDYSKKENPIYTYISYLYLQLKSAVQNIDINFNKIKYSEIIDFDIFYQNTKEYEDYTMSENYNIDSGEKIGNEDKLTKPLFSFLLFANNIIYQYDITLLSMDNIFASFYSVFQVLSIILEIIGNYYYNMFFNKDIKKYFTNLQEEKEIKEILKKIYDFNNLNKFKENSILNEIKNFELNDNKFDEI